MQAIETACCEETREGVGAALNQHTAPSNLRQASEDRGWRDVSVRRRQGENIDTGKLATCAMRRHDKAAGTVVGQQTGSGRKSPTRIDYDARWVGSGDAANRQLRVIRKCAADSDDDSIDQRAKPMQMRETGRSIDVVRMSGRRGDTSVE